MTFTRAAFIALLVPGFAFAQPVNTAPQPVPIFDTIPQPRDVAYPGTIRLTVDASDNRRGIFRVREVIPVASGPLTLLYPAWLPGNHSPTGPIDKLAGLRITGGGKTIEWKRDPVDVYAFHIDVPAGVTSIEAQFQFLSPTDRAQGRVVMTPAMLNLEWNTVALYPAGWFTRRIMVDPTVTYPAGWTAATALETSGPKSGTVRYRPVDFDTLVDSPIFAGLYARTETLAPGVKLNIFADRASQLAATPEQIAPHRRLVDQAVKLYGAQHYDHYEFLFALSDVQSGVGLEHHRSSENGVGADYFTDWDKNPQERDLLPHEYTHSWNGKYRRGADLWTPDYRTPMRDSLLWVYEGQTQFWGFVLSARSGLLTKQETLDAIAATAALYDSRPGRSWRPVIDTTNDPIISQRRPKAWTSWQRSEDYYSEGQLVWLDADSLIRQRSGGKRSLDDFARAFFGVNDRDWGELTYTFDDVVATLNKVEAYDWATFLHERIDDRRARAPLDGLTRGGYKLVYTDTPTAYFKSSEAGRKSIDLSYSLGLVIGKDGAVTGVQWDSPAFDAGLTVGTKLIAIGGRAYDDDALKDAITTAKDGKTPISLLVQQGSQFRNLDIRYSGGLRYPRLERTAKGPSTLDALLTAK